MDAVAVRDSKDPDGPVLLVTRAALRSAVDSARTTR
ncbi:regulator [Actinomadura verrucosospora]|uniref:Regulator n=1 Tax=Actinomadura verrucosospora TaxID=46165 RepID=A0A7D3ZPM0_ACTVE|nr:regulator [Actinomadura verrucosospora]